MRYRPLGATGVSVSAITLVLPAGAAKEAEAYRLVCAALEQGVNSFEIADGDAAAAAALRRAVEAVGRQLMVLTLRLGPQTPQEAVAAAREAARATQAGRFDMALLDLSGDGGGGDPGGVLRAERLARLVGVDGDPAAVDAAVKAGGYDLLAAGYGLRSGWPERTRIKTAVERGMTVLGRDFLVDPTAEARAEKPKGLAGLFRRPKGSRAVLDAYAFLGATPGWTAAQLCLAYALTEPSLASVQVTAASPTVLQQLAEATERELPPHLAAQIEIARFAVLEQGGA